MKLKYYRKVYHVLKGQNYQKKNTLYSTYISDGPVEAIIESRDEWRIEESNDPEVVYIL